MREALDLLDLATDAVAMHDPHAFDVERASAIERAGREVVEIAGRGIAEQARDDEDDR